LSIVAREGDDFDSDAKAFVRTTSGRPARWIRAATLCIPRTSGMGRSWKDSPYWMRSA